jgi:hypothetical protein
MELETSTQTTSQDSRRIRMLASSDVHLAANSRLSEIDGRKTTCLCGGKGIKFNA